MTEHWAATSVSFDHLIAAKTMIDRTDKCMGLKPERLAADTAYGTGKFLAWIVGKGIAPHIPVRDLSQRDDGTFSRGDFKFDKDHNIYVCTAGKLLKTTGRILTGHVLRYRASTYDCGPCPLKSVLPEHPTAHGPTRRQRGRSRSCTCARRNTGVREIE